MTVHLCTVLAFQFILTNIFQVSLYWTVPAWFISPLALDENLSGQVVEVFYRPDVLPVNLTHDVKALTASSAVHFLYIG